MGAEETTARNNLTPEWVSYSVARSECGDLVFVVGKDFVFVDF